MQQAAHAMRTLHLLAPHLEHFAIADEQSWVAATGAVGTFCLSPHL
jgi:hypothetical protein